MSPARLIAACALLVTLGGHHLLTCAGWSSSAEARMACCQRVSDCHEMARVDACCATGQTEETAQVSSVRAPHAPAPILVTPVRPAADVAFLHVRTAAMGPPLTFRNAVLLI